VALFVNGDLKGCVFMGKKSAAKVAGANLSRAIKCSPVAAGLLMLLGVSGIAC
jgi:hypothetical protein